MPTSIEIAKHTGLSDRTVRDWQAKEILPRSEDMGEVVRAIIGELKRQIGDKKEKNPDKQSLYLEEVRLTKARADKLELEIAEKEGSLVAGNDVVRVWSDYLLACKSKLSSIPTKLAYELAGTLDPTACEGILRSVIDEALIELGSEDFVRRALTPAPDSDGDEAAAKTFDQ